MQLDSGLEPSVPVARGLRRGSAGVRASADGVEQSGKCACADDDSVSCELRRSSCSFKRNSNVVDSSTMPLDSEAVKRTPAGVGRPRVQCRNADCAAQKFLLHKEIAALKADCVRLQRVARGVVAGAECANLQTDIQELKERNAVMDEARRGALRLLASVRG
eukprot:3355738-Pleurochrysis_carterae.AAC.1